MSIVSNDGLRALRRGHHDPLPFLAARRDLPPSVSKHRISHCDFLFSFVFSAPLLSPSGLPLVGAAEKSRLSHAHPFPGGSIMLHRLMHTDECAPAIFKRLNYSLSRTHAAPLRLEGNILRPTFAAHWQRIASRDRAMIPQLDHDLMHT
eukprot:833093-Rhodomonas_salina.1